MPPLNTSLKYTDRIFSAVHYTCSGFWCHPDRRKLITFTSCTGLFIWGRQIRSPTVLALLYCSEQDESIPAGQHCRQTHNNAISYTISGYEQQHVMWRGSEGDKRQTESTGKWCGSSGITTSISSSSSSREAGRPPAHPAVSLKTSRDAAIYRAR